MADSKIAQRIAALLAQAEGEAKAGNEAARDTFLEKAAALQLKYAIDDAMLPQGDAGREGISYMDFCQESNTPLIKAKRILINSVAQANRGRAVMMPGIKPNGKVDRRAKIRVWAHESDLKFISMLYTSLILQMQSMMANDERAAWVGGGKTIQAWRVSYAYGWVERVSQRIWEAKRRNEAAETSARAGTALVLRDRTQVVVDHVAAEIGNTRSTKYRIDDRDEGGKAAGRAAANRADLGGKKVSGSGQRALEA